MIIHKSGNLFDSNCDVLVNTTNSVGPMGAGIAKQFKEKDFNLYKKYYSLCSQGLISPGILFLYDSTPIGKKVLCFPTKKHWKDYSKLEYIELGLKKFVDTYKEKNIKSIAFPMLGCKNGGLKKEDVIPLMEKYLNNLDDIYIELYSGG